MQNNHNQLAVDDSGFFGKKKQEKKLIDQSMVDTVMKAMCDANPIKTIDIAKACGYQTKQDVNPTLYYAEGTFQDRSAGLGTLTSPILMIFGVQVVLNSYVDVPNFSALGPPGAVLKGGEILGVLG